jgi:TetR/AcrR family transcriptional repressor of mexJK operon
VDDPLRAAEDLISLWKGFLDMEVHFEAAPAPSSAELKVRATRAVQIFLRAYAAEKGCSAAGLTKKSFGSASFGR